MFLVVSRWKMNRGREEEAKAKGLKMRRMIRELAGVEYVNVARTDEGDAIVIIGYKDRPTYDRLINDPDGAFAKAAKENELEASMEWVESWRGETEEE